MTAVRIATDRGDIDIELYEAQAPASSAYFLGDVRSGLLDDTSFFRVVRADDPATEPERQIEVIQGGLPPDDPDIAPVVPHESTAVTGLRHLAGSVALARWAPGAVYHSFFICLRDEPGLDAGGARTRDGQGQAVFGWVSSGMDVVRTIHARGGARIVTAEARPLG